MILFTFQYTQRNSEQKVVRQIPAVMFANSTITKAELQERFPDMHYVTAYNCDANPVEVPIDVMLYDQNEVLNLLDINSALEKEIEILKQELINKNREGIPESKNLLEPDPISDKTEEFEKIDKNSEIKKFQNSKK